MKTDPNQLIIKKVNKKSKGEAHGGAWKLAYADFMTSMMAFFLLMWLINATSTKQKKAISDYFGPIGLSKETSGSGKLLDGDTITSKGALQKSRSVPSITTLIPQSNVGDTNTNSNSQHKKVSSTPKDHPKKYKSKLKELDLKDQQNFKKAESQIYKEMQSSPVLKKFTNNLIIKETPEGLKIIIVDKNHRSMFPLGGAKMYDYTVKLLKAVTTAIKALPNKITITGHTDARPYTNKNGYDNWDLSTARANATRSVLVSSGLNPDRIKEVIGKAATDPFIKSDPDSAQNRRITILLLKR